MYYRSDFPNKINKGPVSRLLVLISYKQAILKEAVLVENRHQENNS